MTSRFGPNYVPTPEEMGELSQIVQDYRDIGSKVVADRLDDEPAGADGGGHLQLHGRTAAEWAVGRERAVSPYIRVVAGSPPKR